MLPATSHQAHAFWSLYRNGHVKTNVSVPWLRDHGLQHGGDLPCGRIWKGHAGTGAQSLTVARGDCFTLEHGHSVLRSQVCTMEAFTAFVSVAQRRDRAGTNPVSEVRRAS